jgi:hypothetical protein
LTSITIPAHIKNGKLTLDNQYYFKEQLKQLKSGEYEIDLHYPRRTTRQNRYLYKIMQILADTLGYTLNEMKQMVKYECGFYSSKINPDGTTQIVFKSTSDFFKDEIDPAIEVIQRWGAINNIYIMSSDEYLAQFETKLKNSNKQK